MINFIKTLTDAIDSFFDNTGTTLVSDNAEDAIKEIASNVAVSASPGFGWGKPGSASPGEYLLNESVESDKVGRLVPFDGYVFRFFFIEQKKSGTRTLELMRRTSPGTGAFVAIAEVSATGTTPYGNVQFPASGVGSVPVSLNEEFAVRVKGSSADVENIIVGVIIKN